MKSPFIIIIGAIILLFILGTKAFWSILVLTISIYLLIFISLIKLISCVGTPQVENQSLILENKNLKEENRLLRESLESQSKHQEYKVSNS